MKHDGVKRPKGIIINLQLYCDVM